MFYNFVTPRTVTYCKSHKHDYNIQHSFIVSVVALAHDSYSLQTVYPYTKVFSIKTLIPYSFKVTKHKAEAIQLHKVRPLHKDSYPISWVGFYTGYHLFFFLFLYTLNFKSY